MAAGKAGGCEDDGPTAWLRAQMEVNHTHRFRLAIAFVHLQACLVLPLLPHVGIEGFSSSHTVLQALKLVPFSSGKTRSPVRGPPFPPLPPALLPESRHRKTLESVIS